MKGRKPKPTRLRELEGNPGKRPLNHDEPQPEAPAAAFDTPPRVLNGNPAARAEWKRLAPVLRRARQVTEADRGALVAVCLEWARYLAATRGMADDLTVKNSYGHEIQNPRFGIAVKSLAACVRLWTELGCTPSARARVHVAPAGLAPTTPGDAFAAAFDHPEADHGAAKH